MTIGLGDLRVWPMNEYPQMTNRRGLNHIGHILPTPLKPLRELKIIYIWRNIPVAEK